MPDASTAQLVTIAVISAVGGGGLTAATKWQEFRREDRARWVADRRDAYSNLIDILTQLDGSALLATISGQVAGNRADVVRHSSAVCDRFSDSLAPTSVLRLIAPANVVQRLAELETAVVAMGKHYLKGAVGGDLADVDGSRGEDLRRSLRVAMDNFIKDARRDIRA
jgi:hypothetical protein